MTNNIFSQLPFHFMKNITLVQSCVLFICVLNGFKGGQEIVLNNLYVADFDTFKEGNLFGILNCRDWAE